MLRDQAVLIIGVTLLFVAGGLAYSLHQKKQYTASASLSVVDPGLAFGSPTTGLTQAALAAQEAGRIARPSVAARVKATTATSLTIPQLQGTISTRVDPTSSVLFVQAQARNPTLAQKIANAFAYQDARETTRETRLTYRAQVKSLEADIRSAPTVQKSTLQTSLAHAQAIASGGTPVSVLGVAGPGAQTQPKTVRNTLIIGLIGLVLAIAIADARRVRDRRIRRPEEIEAELGLPLIGHVSRNALGHGGAGMNGRESLAPADLESFRVLRQNLQLLDGEGSGLRTVAVTSALAQEGKSTISAMLAHANAAAGKRTLLVEGDLRRPVLAARLGLNESPGLSDYLSGRATPEEILQTVPANLMEQTPASNGAGEAQTGPPAARFVCITAGSPPRPAELLATDRFRSFLREVSDVYELTIIDTSPLLAVVDTLELLPLVDGIAICVRSAKTTRDDTAGIKDALARTRERPTGVVVTGVTPRVDPTYEYYESHAQR
jgi:capsular exopolysaccharide synthesis family protein